MIRKMFVSISCLCALLVQTSCFAGLLDYPNIAVIDFVNNTSGMIDSNAGTEDGSSTGSIGFQDGGMPAVLVMDCLMESERFSIMERSQLKAILHEQSVSNTGLIEQTPFNQIGGLKGVEYLVLGNVVGLGVKNKEIVYGNESGNVFGNTQYTVVANIEARFVEVKTGRVVLTGRGKGASTSTHTEFDVEKISSLLSKGENIDDDGNIVKFGAVSVSQVQVNNALRKAAEDVVFGKEGFLNKLERRAKRRRK